MSLETIDHNLMINLSDFTGRFRRRSIVLRSGVWSRQNCTRGHATITKRGCRLLRAELNLTVPGSTLAHAYYTNEAGVLRIVLANSTAGHRLTLYVHLVSDVHLVSGSSSAGIVDDVIAT